MQLNKHAESGNTVMVFALVLPAAMAMLGAAIDLSVAQTHKRQIQAAADSAVLAATGMPFATTLAAREQMADDVFNANVSAAGDWLTITNGTLTNTSAPGDPLTLTYTVDGHSRTTFSSIFGVNKVYHGQTATAAVTAEGAGNGVEIAMAFDVTASMQFMADDGETTSDQQARDAITTALTSLQTLSGQGNFYVSFMPIADRINIGTDKTDWVRFGNFKNESEGATDGAVVRDDANYNGTVNASNWNGCVHPRYLGDSSAYGLGDDTELIGFRTIREGDGDADGETNATGAGTNLPYFLSDALPTGEGGVPFRAMKESHKAHHDDNYDLRCNAQALIGPTSDVSLVMAALPNLTNAGTGRFDEAFAWSWRLLSPKWNGMWGPADYPEDRSTLAVDATPRRKIMLVFTDGHTTAYNREFDHNQVWGYNKSTPEQMENIGAICEAAKQDGIEIYIFHVLGNEAPTVVDTFQQCVSQEDAYAQSVDVYYHQISSFSDLTAGLSSLHVKTGAAMIVD